MIYFKHFSLQHEDLSSVEFVEQIRADGSLLSLLFPDASVLNDCRNFAVHIVVNTDHLR